MKRLLILSSILILLTGCTTYGTKYSEVKNEPGEIISISFSPEIDKSGVGLSTNGHLSFYTFHEDEKYLVIIRTGHGTFVKDAKELWEKVKPQQQVQVYYREIYNAVFGDNNQVIKQTFAGLDFLNIKIDDQFVWKENRWN